MPYVKPFLRENLIRLSDKAAIHECLVEPIPRSAWDLVYLYENPAELFESLGITRTFDKLSGGRHGLFSTSPPLDSEVLTRKQSKLPSRTDSIVRKLANFANEGEEGILEEKIMAFAPILLKKVIIKK